MNSIISEILTDMIQEAIDLEKKAAGMRTLSPWPGHYRAVASTLRQYARRIMDAEKKRIKPGGLSDNDLSKVLKNYKAEWYQMTKTEQAVEWANLTGYRPCCDGDGCERCKQLEEDNE